MNYAVEINNVQKTIENFKLHSFNLTIEEGTISALIGKNGAGKSTILKMLTGLIKPDEGYMTIFGKGLEDEDEAWKQQIAYLPQNLPLLLAFTGLEMKKLTAQWYPTWDEALFQEIVSLFEIDLVKKFKKLSPGSQQQLNLALTIARNTNLLILDEPTAHLDIPSKKILNDILIQWMDQGNRTIILATHQIEDIQKLADYLIILKEGTILQNVEKESLTETYKRYWFSEMIDLPTIPGVIARTENSLTSNSPLETEQFLKQHKQEWATVQSVKLDEILTFLLVGQGRQ